MELAVVNTGSRARAAYGFSGRLSADFPSQVIMDVTEICNLACVHCPHPEFKKSDRYGGRCLDPELNAKAVDEIRQHGCDITQYLRYTGEGETLLHPKAFELLEYAVQHSGTTVTLTTNGTLLDERRCERGIQSLLEYTKQATDERGPKREIIYRDAPSHNWASHGADAMRYLATGMDYYRPSARGFRQPEVGPIV